MNYLIVLELAIVIQSIVIYVFLYWLEFCKLISFNILNNFSSNVILRGCFNAF
jgi:hypothetical protein